MDQAVPRTGEQDGRWMIWRKADGRQWSAGADKRRRDIISLSGMSPAFFNLREGRFLSCQSLLKRDLSISFHTYFEHDSTCRPCALGYIDSTLMVRIADHGENFALQTDGIAMLIAGFLGSAAGFGEGMAGGGC